MLKFAIYVSDHGFGHATRMLTLAEEFVKIGIFCHIRSARPDFIFHPLNPHYYLKSNIAVDFGVRHDRYLVPDTDRTRQDLLELFSRRQEIVAREVAFLRDEKIDLVIADIPFLIMEACIYASVPVFTISNFDWYFIYSELFSNDRSIHPILNTIQQLYRHANYAFKLPFSSPRSMASFKKCEKVGLLARKKAQYNDVFEQYDLDPSREILLCMFGGEGVPDFSISALCDAFDGYVFSIQSDVSNANHVHVERDADFLDLIYASHLIITKPGYSTFAETLQFNKRILYYERHNYPEERILVDGLRKYHHAYKLESIDLDWRGWKRVLNKTFASGGLGGEVIKNSNQQIALKILSRFKELHKGDFHSVFDFGTNNMNYILMQDERLIHKCSVATALGNGFEHGKLVQSSILSAKTAVLPIMSFNNIFCNGKNLDYSYYPNTKIIATAVSRQATNIDKFSVWLERKLKSKYQILSEKEEIYYNQVAVNDLFKDSSYIAFDIGGGSTEIVYKQGDSKDGISIPLGLKFLLHSYPDHSSRQKVLHDELLSIPFVNPGLVIGIGLTASYLAMAIQPSMRPYQMHKQEVRKQDLIQLQRKMEECLPQIGRMENEPEDSLTGFNLVEPENWEALYLSIDFVLQILDKFCASKFLVCDYGIAYGAAIAKKAKKTK